MDENLSSLRKKYSLRCGKDAAADSASLSPSMTVLLLPSFVLSGLLFGHGRHARGGHHVEDSLGAVSDHPSFIRVNASYYLDAILDHTAPIGSVAHQSKWSQRYYVDDRHWGGEGFPIFLYIGGEGPQRAPSPGLFIYTLAIEQRALVIALEHRFYGESWPTLDMSVKSLAYLTSTQALGDLARFIRYISSYSPSQADKASSPALALKASTAASKWVSFGGSYPGALAVWLKAKYPSLVSGTVGSSAPVYAETDFGQYAQVVGAALGNGAIGGSASCVKVISAAAHEVAAAARAGQTSHFPAALRPCGSLDHALDLATYLASVFGNFQGTVQYNLQGRPPYVSDLCTAVLNAPPEKPLQALAAATALFSPNASQPACIPSSFEKDTISPLANTSFSAAGCDRSCKSMRQWTWQTCNEFGYFQTTTIKGQPFSAFVENGWRFVGAAVCERAFGLYGYSGPRADGAGLYANGEYGARRVLTPRTTMPNGNMDPWHALSVINASDPFFESSVGDGVRPHAGSQRIGLGVSVVELEDTAHCRDMYSPNLLNRGARPIEDTPSVKWAHSVIRANVANYIS